MTTNVEQAQGSHNHSSTMHGIVLPTKLPHVKFYRHPKINWKFSLGHTYKLYGHPESDLELAVYRLTSIHQNIAQTIYTKTFEFTGGMSKNVYKQYAVTVSFLGMERRQVIDYCHKHKVSEEFISVLKGSEKHPLRIPD
jgi:hypothetical protein